MSLSFRKMMLNEYTYRNPFEFKHKHEYSIKCLLIVNDLNKNKKFYHYVLKCNKCNSFIPKSENYNFNGKIFDIDTIDKSIPVIRANSSTGKHRYNFKKLFNVSISELTDDSISL